MLEVVNLCQKMIRCQDLSVIKEKLEGLGFETEILEFFDENNKSVKNLYAKKGQGKPRLLFGGHYDVVSAGDESLWKQPPFEAIIDDDILYGRGVNDMKGGIACFICALEEILKEKTFFDGTISFIISGDEEDPIVEGTKKVLEVLEQRGEIFDFCVVGEPSNSSVVGEEYKIGRRGDVVLEIISKGVQGHSAYAHLAINPIHNLVELLHKLQNTPLDKGNEFFEKSSLQVTTFDVGNVATNVIPAEAKAVIDVRFNSEHSPLGVVEFVKNIISQTEGEFELSYDIIGDSFLTDKNKDVKSFETAILEASNLQAQPSTGGGTSDARYIKDYCPVIEFGLTNKTIHKINEAAKIADIILLKDIYKNFVCKYFNMC
ncbi:MAG: succinyl-diaminopimelate desuccinylase [Alphaproteobacteria bacterium]